jgi:hypothetical protein
MTSRNQNEGWCWAKTSVDSEVRERCGPKEAAGGDSGMMMKPACCQTCINWEQGHPIDYDLPGLHSGGEGKGCPRIDLRHGLGNREEES